MGLFLLTSILAGCTKERVFDRQFLAFGTLISVTIADADKRRAEQAFALVQTRFDKMHHDWHSWHQSELTRINKALQRGDTVSTENTELLDLIRRAKGLSELSGHRFNPFFGSLFKTWGFHQDNFEGHTPPTPDTIRTLLKNPPTADDISVRGATLHSNNPEVWIDLGGIAKGYSIDLVMEQLKLAGIQNAIINAGGDLRAVGKHPDRFWQIGVRDPSSTAVLATISVTADEAIFTSGDYERFFEYEGKRYHHIINPNTGYPTTGFRSVTVVHQDATIADAAATALMVAGPNHWETVAQNMGVSQILLIDRQGDITISPGLADRTLFSEPKPNKIYNKDIMCSLN